MNLVSLLAPHFDRYLTLERVHPTKTYHYKARGFFDLPVIDITMHKTKCIPGSWLYIAVPANANVTSLEPSEKLYIGSQTADRMFRGDGMAGQNFHHAEMRAGNGTDDPLTYLRSGRKVSIFCISAAAIAKAIATTASLSRFQPLLHQPKKHVGYWFEQSVLDSERLDWRWNTAGADRTAQAVLRTL